MEKGKKGVLTGGLAVRRETEVLGGDGGEGFALRHGRVARPRLVQLHPNLIIAAAIL